MPLTFLLFLSVSCFPMDPFWLQFEEFGTCRSFFVSRPFKGGIVTILHQFALDLHTVILNISLCSMQPVGALNSDRLKKFQERYSSFEDPVIPKFHYGSHYSSAGTVGFYFILINLKFWLLFIFCLHHTSWTLMILDTWYAG